MFKILPSNSLDTVMNKLRMISMCCRQKFPWDICHHLFIYSKSRTMVYVFFFYPLGTHLLLNKQHIQSNWLRTNLPHKLNISYSILRSLCRSKFLILQDRIRIFTFHIQFQTLLIRQGKKKKRWTVHVKEIKYFMGNKKQWYRVRKCCL